MLRYRFVSKVIVSSFLCASVSLQAMATYTITGNTTLTNNATYSNNADNGIQVTTPGTYVVGVQGDLNVANNKGQGLRVMAGSNVTFTGTTGNDSINLTNSGQRGMHISANTTTNFNNLDILVADSGSDYGICTHGVLNIQGNGNNLLQVINNKSVAGIHVYREAGGVAPPQLSISDMNVDVSGNTNYGIQFDSASATLPTDGILNISSASGTNTLKINNNGATGLSVSNGKAHITNMNVEIASNKGAGIQLGKGSVTPLSSIVNVTGNGENTLNIHDNFQEGISVSYEDSQLNIKDTNVSIIHNGFDANGVPGYSSGFSVWGEANIEGNGNNYIALNDNQRAGLAIANRGVVAGFVPKVTISDMDIMAAGNGEQGIDVSANDGVSNAILNVSSTHNNTVMTEDNGLQGIRVSKGGTINLTGMNVVSQNNGAQGILVENSTMNVTGNGSTVLQANSNTGNGIDVSGAGSSLTIKDMDVEIKENNGIALNALNTTLHLSSVSGKDYMKFYGNKERSFYALNTNTTIDKMNIFVSDTTYDSSTSMGGIGMCSHGILEMTGNGLSAADGASALVIYNSSRGLHIANSDVGLHYATIKDYDVVLGGNDLYGLWVNDSIGTISSSTRENLLAFGGNGLSIYLQSEGKANATNTGLTIDGMNIYSQDLNFAKLEGSAGFTTTLNIQDSKLELHGTDLIFDLNNGILTLKNVKQSGGVHSATLIENTGVSSTLIDNGSFVFGKVTDNGTLDLDVLGNSRWNMQNTSNVANLTVDNSSIDLRSFEKNKYNTLTIDEAYNGNNATMYMNANLDAAQETDQLVLSSGVHAMGKTNLNITNTVASSSYGTFIKDDGIKVVDAQGSATTGAGTFDLVGKKIDSGLYIQELYYQNLGMTDESWYLRTATIDNGGGNIGSDGSYSNGERPKPTDLTKTIASMPAVALSVVKTINSELRNRLGELRSNNPKATEGMWVRGYYKTLEVDENIKNEMDISGVEAGYDHLISKNRLNRTYLGIMAGYAQADKLKVHQENGYQGKGEGTVPSVGAYLTWINKNGWYTDAVIRGFLTQLEVTNYSAQGLPITYDADRMALSGSFEFGRRTPLYQSGRNGIVIEPKAQITYTYMPEKEHETNLNQKIKYDTTQSLVTRAAIMAAYRRTFANGIALEPFVQVGVAYEWLGKTDVMFIGSDFTSDVSGMTYEGVLGLNARLSKGWHLYSDLTLETGSVYKSFGGHLGARYNF